MQSQSHDLDFFLSEGLKNSPMLNDFRNRISSAYADSLLIRAEKMPRVEASSQLQYFPVYKNFGYDEVITDGGNYSALMGVSQNILNKKTTTNRYRSVQIEKQSIGVTAKLTEMELRKVITGQYLATFAAYSDLKFNTSFLALSQEENDIVRHFVENGIFRRTDYLSLLVETQAQEILVGQLKGAFRKEMMLLNRICGINDTLPVELEEPLLVESPIPDFSSSPLFRQYLLDSMKIENEKVYIDLRYKPKVSWFADAGFLTSNPWNFYNHFGYSAGLSLSIPVYDGRQRDYERQKLELSENSRRFYSENYRIQYDQQASQLKGELRSLEETILKTRNQLGTSGRLVRDLKTQLEAGMVNMTDYINAIKNYRNINRNLILVNIQRLQVINEINSLSTQ